jgi:ABC-type lipoprotein release transport system permease subunit
MTALVELTEVGKTYDGAGGRAALVGVSLDVEDGEFTALGVMGLAIAVAGAAFPARRAARSRTAAILRSE